MPYYQPKDFAVSDAKESTDLVALALAQMWDVPKEQKDEMVKQQFDLMKNELMPPSIRIKAAKNVLMMGVTNLKALEVATKVSLGQTADTGVLSWDALLKDVPAGPVPDIVEVEIDKVNRLEYKPNGAQNGH